MGNAYLEMLTEEEIYWEFVEPGERIVHLHIFTNEESKKAACWNYYWSIYAKNALDGGEFIKNEGAIVPTPVTEYEKEIMEFQSACDALEWVKANYPGIPVTLFVSSEILPLAVDDIQVFHRTVEDTENYELERLAIKFGKTIVGMNIEIFTYDYANKDVIPFFF